MEDSKININENKETDNSSTQREEAQLNESGNPKISEDDMRDFSNEKIRKGAPGQTYETLKLYQKIYDFSVYIHPILQKFHRTDKISLVPHIESTLYNMMDCILKYEKSGTVSNLYAVDAGAESIITYLKLAKDYGNNTMTTKRLAFCNSLLREIGAMVGPLVNDSYAEQRARNKRKKQNYRKKRDYLDKSTANKRFREQEKSEKGNEKTVHDNSITEENTNTNPDNSQHYTNALVNVIKSEIHPSSNIKRKEVICPIIFLDDTSGVP